MRDYLTEYEILLVNNGLMFSWIMTKEEAHRYIQDHPKFRYRYAAL